MRAPWSSPTFIAFKYPVFRRVWAAGLVSKLGDWMQIGIAFMLAIPAQQALTPGSCRSPRWSAGSRPTLGGSGRP
ncbi:MAG: hypothetical protein ACXW2C_06330 [Acidimicrobiia bacterium]